MPRLTRRGFLGAASLAAAQPGSRVIDRKALVRRHNPVLSDLDPRSPLSVGNGECAFTADITGLQTFPELFEKTIPLCTQSQWGWHSFPKPADLPAELRLEPYDAGGRQVGYATNPAGQKQLFDWLRENPHRLHLGRIGFDLKRDQVSAIRQELDLWTGVLTSEFQVEGRPVRVRTCCHPTLDAVAVAVESERPLRVRIAFPYGSPGITAADWNRDDAHRSELSQLGDREVSWTRTLDGDSYAVRLRWDGDAQFGAAARHGAVLSGSRFSIAALFTPTPATAAPDPKAVFASSERHWARFWSSGAAVELAGSKDPRAPELERRVVLSQYLTAIQCSGSMPPQETGLTCNSWYGKFHLEMHWWHAVHFALWDRLPLLERSLGWYSRLLPEARRIARSQGYAGARWPKMVGPEGRDSPSGIGPLLVWQQPHPIVYAELAYATRPSKATLARYRDIVLESAEFMASYARLSESTRRYNLGPPVIPAQENHLPRETWNPTYELVYWRHGLEIAQQWRLRLGLSRMPEWDRVAANLAPLPVKDGVYLAHENCPQTYTDRNRDHPSMLAALGVLPGKGVDRETMRRTLHKVWREWKWDETWGWDFPMTAMTAARLGETRLAVDALLKPAAKNTYLPNGHNPQRPGLGLYLPGNGGLLAAIAMMAGGWQGGPKAHAPGFPADAWNVRAEALRQLL